MAAAFKNSYRARELRRPAIAAAAYRFPPRPASPWPPRRCPPWRHVADVAEQVLDHLHVEREGGDGR